jgi:hypothetical protein
LENDNDNLTGHTSGHFLTTFMNPAFPTRSCTSFGSDSMNSVSARAALEPNNLREIFLNDLFVNDYSFAEKSFSE